MHQNRNHLFFDLDHTLWDFRANSRKVLKKIYRESESAQEVSEEEFLSIYKSQNAKFWDRYRKGYIRSEELRWKRFWHTMLVIGDADVGRAKIMGDKYLDLLPTESQLCPGARDVLDFFSERSYNMHIITNGFQEVQIQKIKSAGLDKYFQTITSSENAKAAKPDPKIFRFALDNAGSSKPNSTIIGDSLTADVKGAIEFGIKAIFYNPHEVVNPFEDIAPTITDLRTLKEIL